MALEHDSDSALAHAVRMAGSQTAFAVLLGTRQSTVHSWLAAGRSLPPQYVLDVEAKLGIPRWSLRPDIYPPEEYAQSPGARPVEAPAAVASTAAGVRHAASPKGPR